MATFVSSHVPERHVKRLPKKWLRNVLRTNLRDIKNICKLETTSFRRSEGSKYPTNEEEANQFVKDRIQFWITNFTDCVEAIEETLPKDQEHE